MRLPGQRIIKTTVSVFLTSYICVMLNWPPVFAVITAIVTIEPTVNDSIKKGIVRFPASAIGSFFAVLFIALFGNSPLTYTLAASLTIIVCYQLRLYAGLLVATITAVAMVEVIYDNFVLSFFIRLGTTTTGIVVSTLVNMLILPPNYTKQIDAKIKGIYKSFSDLLDSLIFQDHDDIPLRIQVEKIDKDIQKTHELIRFQHDQSMFQATLISKKEVSQIQEAKLEKIKILHYHLSNISEVKIATLNMSEIDQNNIEQTIQYLSRRMNDPDIKEEGFYEKTLQSILDMFWQTERPKSKADKFPEELTLLYELITIIYILNGDKYQKKRLEK